VEDIACNVIVGGRLVLAVYVIGCASVSDAVRRVVKLVKLVKLTAGRGQ